MASVDEVVHGQQFDRRHAEAEKMPDRFGMDEATEGAAQMWRH
jgi:hypothetical protein